MTVGRKCPCPCPVVCSVACKSVYIIMFCHAQEWEKASSFYTFQYNMPEDPWDDWETAADAGVSLKLNVRLWLINSKKNYKSLVEWL